MIKLDLTIQELATLLESEVVNGNKALLRRKVKLCMDSREAGPGMLFWPLVGAKFDAHNFIASVLQQGVLMSIVQESQVGRIPYCAYIPVADTTEALLKLARGWQRRFTLKKVAITGSNGKTTTKDMIQAILSKNMRIIATKGNLNNQIGVPMTLFRINHSLDAAVIEMGTNAPGEIRPLSMATEPNIAVITNVGHSHLEGLGSVENVFKEKSTITAGLVKNGVLIVNADDPHLSKMRTTTRYKVVTFGVRRGQFSPQDLSWDGNACAKFRIGRTWFTLKVPGIHNLYNALSAIAVGVQMGVAKSEISSALAGFRASNMRMELRNFHGFKVAVDCYNANPSSTRMALETIGNVKRAERKIAVLGDMLELGDQGRKLHREVGQLVPQMGFDLLCTFGDLTQSLREGALASGMSENSCHHFSTRSAMLEYLQGEVQGGDLILVKGSRGMKLEEIVQGLSTLEPASRKLA